MFYTGYEPTRPHKLFSSAFLDTGLLKLVYALATAPYCEVFHNWRDQNRGRQVD